MALVTGAARRVGRAIALELAAGGCDVGVHYHRSEDDAGRVAGEIEGIGRRSALFCGDLSLPQTAAGLVEQVRERFGGLDVLVNNASIFAPDPQGDFDSQHWERMFQINVFSAAALIERAAEALARSGCGKVVNLCDISAERPWRGYAAYCSSKAALVGITKAYALRLAPRVQVNGVSPGIAVFPDDYSHEVREKLVDKVPLKRAGSPQDVARAVGYLVESGDYVTGQIIKVDGGRSIL